MPERPVKIRLERAFALDGPVFVRWTWENLTLSPVTAALFTDNALRERLNYFLAVSSDYRPFFDRVMADLASGPYYVAEFEMTTNDEQVFFEMWANAGQARLREVKWTCETEGCSRKEQSYEIASLPGEEVLIQCLPDRHSQRIKIAG